MSRNSETKIESREGYLWIGLPDAIDMDNYQRIEDAISNELGENQSRIALDFDKTRYLFSSGLGLIIRLKKKVEALEKKFFLINMNKKLREGLQNVGLDKSFTIYESIEQFFNDENIPQ